MKPKELKQIKADDQAIQTILLGLPKDIYAAVDSCETAQEIWLRVQQMMKGSDIGIQEKKAKLFNEWEMFTFTDEESIESYYHRFLKLMNDLKRNKHFPEKIASNLKFLNNSQPEWSRHVTIVHQTKDLHTADYTQLYDFLKYNQKEVDDLKSERLAKIQDPLALMAISNNPYTFPVLHQDQPSLNQNYMQQPMPNPKEITDPTTAMNMALALMAKAFKLNYSTPTNNNQRISSNPRNRQIAQPCMNMGQDRQMQMVGGNDENQFRQYAGHNNAGNHNPNGNSYLVASRAEGNATGYNADLDEIKEVNANCILMANLQQASTLGTQTDKSPVYDLDGSAEVHNYENCYDNEIFNMFTQDEKYTELLEPIHEPHQVPQNDNNVISEVTSVEQSERTVEQHPANFKETRVLYESLYHNLAIEVEKVNTVNRKLKETNAELTTEIARFKNQVKCFEIGQEKYDKLERCYQKFVYQEQCLSKKINALHLSFEKKKLKSDFKIREDELLDNKIQLEKRIKELDNILVKTGQSIQMIHMLSPKPDSFYHTEQKMALGYQNPFYLKQAQQKQQSLYDGKVLFEKHDPPIVHDSEETLQLAQKSRQKMKQLNKEIKPANYTKINHLSGVFVSQTVKSREELYFSNASKTATVSKLISILNEEFSDDTTPSVAQAAKFVGDFKSLTKEANESLAKHKALELEIERLLRVIISQDIMSVVQNNFVGETSNLQSELEPYNDMQQKIERLQAQLGELKGKSKDTSCVSDTLNPLSQKLENENVELEFQVLNYAKENGHLKTTYTIYKNAKLRAQLFNKVSDQKDITRDTSVNTKFAKQSIVGNLPKVIQICLWCVDSGYSKHMTGNLKLLINFVWKFLGTVRFRNDHVAAILDFGDLQWGNILITRVYFVEGLGHNLFSIGQFCDSDLKVAFRRNTYFVRNLEGVDLLKGNHTTNVTPLFVKKTLGHNHGVSSKHS
uniref:Integrase, catalytic region, zinc finger, CCHC-type, peptidase aspartic, catalytic n=1 Tax=Tanacetum cinerariifolium TaxID=118510 RepID=A0A699I3G2_TANCI|nr:integrase, catalytic region, zinc finger, CCHC-type, peptidase aspartic, catalytic [Tanacetum cinerariifolium]